MKRVAFLVMPYLLSFGFGGLAVGLIFYASFREKSLWPPQDKVIAIEIDMYCWTEPELRGKRFQLTVARDGNEWRHPGEEGIFLHMLQCIRESSPNTTAPAREPMGKIDLILDDGNRIRVFTYPNQYLTLKVRETHVHLIFDADTFESYVARYARVVPHPEGELMFDSRGPFPQRERGK